MPMWLKLVKPIDRVIDGISMSRLLLYYLVGLLIASIGLSASGAIHYNAAYIAISAAILVFTCWLINKILGYLFSVPVYPESSIITGLILALIMPPLPTGSGLLSLLAVSGLAMASKYILNIKGKHIFNPAAIAVVLMALGPGQNATWWVGTSLMLPFVIAGGILVIRKVRREQMVGMFLAVTTITTATLSFVSRHQVGVDLQNMVLNSAVFYLGFVMLTEPYTSPTTRKKQLWYAAIVGVIIAPQFHIGHYYSTPEIALIAGNIFAYVTGNKFKAALTIFHKNKIARDTAEFVFVTNQKINYQAGQYMEFTLPHDNTDSRGTRRYFTLSSSPTESQLKIGVKFYDEGSTYKSALLDINRHSLIVASQLSGDFVLPTDPKVKLVFIAGGIGITPFRSMVKYLVDTNQQRDIILIYSAKTEKDFAYRELFEEARTKIGLSTHYVVTDSDDMASGSYARKAVINGDMLKALVSDYPQRAIYISGSHPMVESIQSALHLLGIKRANIKIDFFPGYV